MYNSRLFKPLGNNFDFTPLINAYKEYINYVETMSRYIDEVGTDELKRLSSNILSEQEKLPVDIFNRYFSQYPWKSQGEIGSHYTATKDLELITSINQLNELDQPKPACP
ncbi:TPA: hypothetical protein ACTXXA_003658 [Legionella anisa]